ncbi:carbohydrate kinase family protein [Succinimonas amylolytica]|uniref:carbohydrate kinase family protein n=1 Tax=Succinimonas amylolytica TaxID=83769 RepID=UPI000363E536|nr:carbohydrate kinase family protein [Succinimonas amylolytica]
MSRILVSGLFNMETAVRIRGFPVSYYPIDYDFFGVTSSLSGVAFNLTKALTALGDTVVPVSMTGQDAAGELFLGDLRAMGLQTDYVLPKLKETPASAVLYDETGRRQIYCDLKDIQDTAYDFDRSILDGADAVAACNINFSRPLLDLARDTGKLIATDVHVLSGIDDAYNRNFMEHADILFLSDEGIPSGKEDFVRALGARYHNRVIVLGMGDRGALLHLPAENVLLEQPAFAIGGVVNTVGAGDALFSAYLHFHLKGLCPEEALRRAQLFAALKIREKGAARGFVSEKELEEFLRG